MQPCLVKIVPLTLRLIASSWCYSRGEVATAEARRQTAGWPVTLLQLEHRLQVRLPNLTLCVLL